MITSFFVNLSGSIDVNVDDSGTRRTVNVPIAELPSIAGEAFANGVAWLQSSVLSDGEEFRQTLAEPSAWAGEDGARRVYSFAVTVQGPLGERTEVVSSEQMPEVLRDQIIAAVEAIEAHLSA